MFILIFIVIIFLVIMIEMTVKMGGGGAILLHTMISILLKNKNIKKGVDKPFIVLKMGGFKKSCLDLSIMIHIKFLHFSSD